MESYLSRRLSVSNLEQIFDVFDDGVYITDAGGLTLKVNSAYERMTGVSAKQVEGRYMSDIVREGILSNTVTQDVVATKGEVEREQVIRNGTRVALRGIPMYVNGRIAYVVTFVRDITEIDELQHELDASRSVIAQHKTRLAALESQENFVAASHEFRAAILLAHKVAVVDSTVLILGESGTGKEVLAREVHEKSSRRKQPFLKINCGAIPENLLDAELFGYEGGAFTGAKKNGHIGLFEEATGGTLLLDEIGDMPLHLQVKLLRVLQERSITRIGSTRAIPVSTRVIAATNKNLEQMVREKTFREDLYYRLNIVAIYSPPLRERKADIPGLINFFVRKLNAKYQLNKQLSAALVSSLMSYDWPGNVRELENMIERILVISTSDIITPAEAHLPWNVGGPSVAAAEIAQPFETVPLKVAFERLERQMLLEAAKHYKTTYQIAEALQISQPSVSRKLKRYRSEVAASEALPLSEKDSISF